MNKRIIKRREKFIKELKILPHNWSKEQLCDWMADVIGYPQYVPKLKKKKITGSKFIVMVNSKIEMKKIGIEKIGHVKLILKEMKKMGVEILKTGCSENIENNNGGDFIFNSRSKLKSNPSLLQCMNGLNSNNTNYGLQSPITFRKNNNTFEILNNCNNTLESEIVYSPFMNINEKVLIWNQYEISLWLDSLQLINYAHLFKSNSIRGDVLMDIEVKHLREIGICAMGDVKRIINSIRQLHPSYFKSKDIKEKMELSLNSENNLIHPPSIKEIKKWNVFDVIDWLRKIGFNDYVNLFFENRIDGTVLLQINKNDLHELKMSSVGIQKKFLLEIQLLKEKL